MKKYTHLTDIERNAIAYYLNQGLNYSEIGRLLDRNNATIGREVKRNSKENGQYEPAYAQASAEERLSSRKTCEKLTSEIKEQINQSLSLNWSPMSISGVYRKQEKNFPSFCSIYRYIHDGKVGSKQLLRRKGKPFKRSFEVNRMKGGKSIHERPTEANNRQRLGDWEIDTVVGPKGTTAAIVTVVDRCSRKLLAQVAPDRKAATVTQRLLDMLKNEVVCSLTADNGKEFSNYEELEEKLQVPVYFADPYCSWQRGTNENTNGLLREYIPKGKDIAQVTQEELDRYVYLINTRPRRIFGFCTALDQYKSSA
ncbi:TPA: IS30 family transposase [Enterococcus faecalis]|nr:IS30 family transposase [Enterococcus faecalis]